MMRYKKVKLLCLLVLSVVILASDIWACDCGQAPGPELAFQKYDVIFTAKVSAIDPDNDFQDLVTLDVADMFKGEGNIRINVLNARELGSCGVDFKLGGDYLVYARYQAGTKNLYAHRCSPTKLLNLAQQEEIDKLKTTSVYAIDPDKAVEISLKAAQEIGITDVEQAPVKVELKDGVYTVTFVYVYPSGSTIRGPDYHAQVKIDAATCEIVQFLGAS